MTQEVPPQIGQAIRPAAWLATWSPPIKTSDPYRTRRRLLLAVSAGCASSLPEPLVEEFVKVVSARGLRAEFPVAAVWPGIRNRESLIQPSVASSSDVY